MEKLSIIVPVYNVYPYLRQCLDSIINQTYKKLEIIVVNDASPYSEDDEICKEYATRDERIIYIKHEVNKGLGGARNTGIKAATGKYIAFIDSDDYLCDMHAYEECMDILYKNKSVDILGFDAYQYDVDRNEKNIMNLYQKVYKKSKYIMAKKLPSEIVCAKIFKKDIFKENILFMEKIKFEDTEFWYRLNFLKKIKYINIDKAYYTYRVNSNSITNTAKNFIQIYDIYDIIYNNAVKYGKLEEYKRNFIQFTYIINKRYKLLNDSDKKSYIKRHIEFIKHINITGKDIREYGDFKFILQFIDDDYVRDLCFDVLYPYKMIKYKIAAPNIMLYKIKREIKRIIKKLRIK